MAIETKHLVDFIKNADFVDDELYDADIQALYKEYIGEIVTRLEELDKLKSGQIK
jgi:hypothetical protein